MNGRLIHDGAVAMSKALMEVVENSIRPEARLDAYSQLYIVCKGGVEAYETQRERMERRLAPSNN